MKEGYILDEILQRQRDAKAACRLLVRLLKQQGSPPRCMITDKLGSYAAARRQIMPSALMLIAAGYWPSVPNENFNGRLFEAITRFQSEMGYRLTGYLTSDQTNRLTGLGQPVINDLGLRRIPHPYRGHLLRVPMGLGLVETRTPKGLSFADPQRHVKIHYEYYPDLTLGHSYAAWLSSLVGSGAQISYKATRTDFFAIVAGRDVQSWYVRFHEDGDGIVGFSLRYLNTDPSIHGLALQTLMSASMWSAMSPGALDLPMPELTIPISRPPIAPPATLP